MTRAEAVGRKGLAVAIIATGLVLLISNIFNIDLFDFEGGWPFFVLLPGLIMLAVAISGEKKLAGFIFPGAIVTGTGAILFVQNLTDHWESWAYVWALYPVFVGLALMFYGNRTDNANNVRAGRNLAFIGMVLLAAFGVFFELIAFNNVDGRLVNAVVAVLMIGGGGFLLLRARNSDDPALPRRSKRKNDADIQPELKRKIEEALAE